LLVIVRNDDVCRPHSAVESRGEANGFFANLAKSHVIFSHLSILTLTAFAQPTPT
jgi:hypothetical protein